jgi:hypothetical protein
MSKRPSFGQWLKYTWLDILTMAIMGAIGLGVSYPVSPTSCLRPIISPKATLKTEFKPVQSRSTKPIPPRQDHSRLPS